MFRPLLEIAPSSLVPIALFHCQHSAITQHSNLYHPSDIKFQEGGETEVELTHAGYITVSNTRTQDQVTKQHT